MDEVEAYRKMIEESQKPGGELHAIAQMEKTADGRLNTFLTTHPCPDGYWLTLYRDWRFHLEKVEGDEHDG